MTEKQINGIYLVRNCNEVNGNGRGGIAAEPEYLKVFQPINIIHAGSKIQTVPL